MNLDRKSTREIVTQTKDQKVGRKHGQYEGGWKHSDLTNVKDTFTEICFYFSTQSSYKSTHFS